MKNEDTNQKLKPEHAFSKSSQAGVTSKFKPERVQAGLTFTVNGKPIDSEHLTFIVDNTVLYPEHVDLGVITSKLKPERVQAGFTLVAEGFRYAARGRAVKAIKSFKKAIDIFRKVATDFASLFSFALDIGLTAVGVERLKPEHAFSKSSQAGITSKLKPERVQAGLRFTLDGTPIESDEVIVIVGGQEVAAENMHISIAIAKLKPEHAFVERCQAGFTLAADGLLYAVRGRFSKAVNAFAAAIDTFAEIASDLMSVLDFSVEIDATDNSPEGSEA